MAKDKDQKQDAKAKPEKQQKNLNKALTKLFENYPPRAK